MFQGVISSKVKFKKHKPINDNQTLSPPNGVWIRVWPLQACDSTKGGLKLDTQSIEDEERGCTIGYVECLGTLAYKHPKFESIQYCTPGQYVLFQRHQGMDFEINGRHFKLIQDDRPLQTFTEEELIKLGVLENE